MIPKFTEIITLSRCKAETPTLYKADSEVIGIHGNNGFPMTIQQTISTVISPRIGNVSEFLGAILCEMPILQWKEIAPTTTEMEKTSKNDLFPTFPRYHPKKYRGYLDFQSLGKSDCTEKSIFFKSAEDSSWRGIHPGH